MSARPYCHLFCGLIVAALAFAPAAAAWAFVVKDANGKSVSITDASRIVSVGGAVTEILYAIGLEDRVVAVDTTSLYPQSALNKPKVGYMRQLSPEGVLGLAPTLILASEGSGPKETISVLESASVPFVSVPDHFTGDGILEKISVVSSAAGAAGRGECLSHAVKDDLDALTSLRKGIDRPKRVLFVLSFMNDRPMVAGRATAADGVIKLAGATNAIDGYEGYKLINDESIIAAKPDAILVMQRGPESLTAETVFANPAFSITPAAKEKAFISMEGLYLLGFGPRTALAARDLAGVLYPELKTDKLPSEAAGQSAQNCR
jgi:iron complex transport system substrate-binding protein